MNQNQLNVAQQVQPEPPDVKIIECNCALAQNKSQDFSEFTNVLREPILIKKGSSIRVASSFIDSKGIDQEILQFDQTGDDQDNSHSLLTQIYTCNDGFQNKTTTYDYLTQNKAERRFQSITLGNGFDPVNGHTITTIGGGTGTGLQLTAKGTYALEGIVITNGGKNYNNWDKISLTITNPAPGNNAVVPYGRAIVNDKGSVVDFILQEAGYAINGASTFVVNITNITGGSGFSATGIFKNNGASFNVGQDTTRFRLNGGTGYTAGDIVNFTSPGGDAMSIRLGAVNKTGVPNTTDVYFDVGYNYKRAPLLRWAQTFALSNNFCGANNWAERTFTSNNNKVYSINGLSHTNKIDSLWAADSILKNKEDEFASGIFHRKGQNNLISIYKPILNIWDRNPTFGIKFERINGIGVIVCANHVGSDNVIYNPISRFVKGLQFNIDFEPQSTFTNAEFIEMNDLFAKKWGGVYVVQSNTSVNTDITINGINYTNGYRIIEIGSPNAPDNVGNITQFVPLNNNITGPPNTNQNYQLTNLRRDDGQAMDGEGAFVNIVFDGAGASLPENMTINNEGVRYKVGDILGAATGNANTTIFYVTRTGIVNGNSFPDNTGTPLYEDGLVLASDPTKKVLMNMIPMSYYPIGLPLGNGQPPSDEWTLNYSYSGCIKQAGNNGAAFRYPAPYNSSPSTFSEIGLLLPNNVNDNITTNLNVGLHKPNGLLDTDINYEPKTASFQNHNDTAPSASLGFHCPQNSTPHTQNFVVGAATDPNPQIVPIAGGTPVNINDSHFIISKAYWTSLGFDFLELPKTYLVLQYDTLDETHCYVDYIDEITISGKDFWKIWIRQTNIHEGISSKIFSNDAAILNGVVQRTFNRHSNTNFNAGDNITFTFFLKDKEVNNPVNIYYAGTGNNGIDVKNYDTIPFTSPQNFYYDKDINLEKTNGYLNPLNRNKNWDLIYKFFQTSQPELQSYEDGAIYFLTNNKGYLCNQDSDNNDLVTRRTDGYAGPPSWGTYGFNNGFNEIMIAQITPLEGEFGTWNIIKNTKNQFNYITTAEFAHAYEPLYRQKTLAFNRNYGVPDDVSGYWTKSSHELINPINMATGEDLIDLNRSGLLSNEFCFPVYGSNNDLNNAGDYIPNFNIYANSSGLEEGHVIGRNYIDSFEAFLPTDILNLLPKDANNNSYYNIYFRTAFTFCRNYDPLKELTGGNAGKPDFNALETLSTTAKQVGNASINIFNSAGAYQSTTYKYTLDGARMPIGTIDPSPVSGNPPASQANYLLYELAGKSGTPLQVGGGGATSAVSHFPDRALAYPIRYIENDNVGTFNKAKASSYVGAYNMNLTFSNTLSSFAFQNFYSPFTSPFVDGQGGDDSVRVFYGNRVEGIYNHDAVGGVAVINYCRPDYPNGIFSPFEIDSTQNISQIAIPFPNGINPLRDTGEIGVKFLNKLGFTNTDIGITSDGTAIDTTSNKVGISYTPYTRSIILDSGQSVNNTSYNEVINATNGALLDSSDAVLSIVSAPEVEGGLLSNRQFTTPLHGTSRQITRLWGDYIYYPYSIDNQSNTFNVTPGSSATSQPDASKVEFNNGTDAYNTIGGLRLSNSARGMGLPNTLGSTTLVNQNTIPRTLNPDCNIYLSYTIQASSNNILASELPRKLNAGHIVIMSSLIEEPNFILSSAGAVNGISVVNKSFLTGDFILSIGQLQFYAKQDRYISSITTKLVNSNYKAPTTLGDQTTIIYEIINNNPKPAVKPQTITEIQQQDYQLMAQLQKQMAQERTITQSKLAELDNELYQLGMSVLQPTDDEGDIIDILRTQIAQHGLADLTLPERQEFFATDEGRRMIRHAQNVRNVGNAIAQGNLQEETIEDLQRGILETPQERTQRQEIFRQIREMGDYQNVLREPLSPGAVPEELTDPELLGQMRRQLAYENPSEQFNDEVMANIRGSNLASGAGDSGVASTTATERERRAVVADYLPISEYQESEMGDLSASGPKDKK